jgi:hypothetical protein
MAIHYPENHPIYNQDAAGPAVNTITPAPVDFVQAARARAMERRTTVTEAMKELARMDPAAHRRWVEAQGPLIELDRQYPD